MGMGVRGGGGELHKFFWQMGVELWFPWQHIVLIYLQRETLVLYSVRGYV